MAKAETVEKDNAVNPAPQADNEVWEEVRVGLGEAWDFEKNPILIGRYMGAQVMELKEEGLDGRKDATAHEFELDNGDVVFAWSSFKLGQALVNVGMGDRVKIEYRGKIGIKDDKQQLRQYRVWVSPGQQKLPVDFGDESPF